MGDRLWKRQMMALPMSPQPSQIRELQLSLLLYLFNLHSTVRYFSLDFPSLLSPQLCPCVTWSLCMHTAFLQFVSLDYTANLLCCCKEGFKIMQCLSQRVQVRKSTVVEQAPSLLTKGDHKNPTHSFGLQRLGSHSESCIFSK